MKKIELIWPTNIVCPFCNQLIQTINEDDEVSEFKRCEHTIFSAHDEGFEFRTNLVNSLLNIDPKEDGMDIEVPDEICGFDGFTDLIKIDGAIKIAAYEDCTNPAGIYYGFIPD